MKKSTEIRKVIGSQTTDKSVHGQAIFEVLKSANSEEERLELLEIVLTELRSVDKHGQVLSNKGLSTEEWNELDRKHSTMIKDFARNSYFETNNIHDFSKEILRLINFFNSENEKAFCLSMILYSTNIIPYMQIPGSPVRISSEEHKQLLLADKERSELILYLVNLPFYDWDEAASQVLQVIDDVSDKKLRVALLSLFMTAKIKEVKK